MSNDFSSSKENFTNSWQESLDALKLEIENQVYSAFIQPLVLKKFDNSNNEILIDTPSSLVREQVDRRFSDRIRKLINSKTGKEFKLILSVDNKLLQTKYPEEITRNRIIKTVVKNKTSSSLNKNYTFSNFVLGKNNEFCSAIARNISENPGKEFNPLFIYGGVGLGKTHLLHSIGNNARKKDSNLKILYTSSENFTNRLVYSLKDGTINKFKKELRSIDILLIDDIQFIAGKERTQEEFFHTFNALYELGSQIVLTSDKMPNEIPGIEEKLKTRFAWGITSDLRAPDYETRMAILSQKAEESGIYLPIDVCSLLAKKNSH